jgi:hypothetical protein
MRSIRSKEALKASQPAKFEAADAEAIQALNRGDADPYQQVRALKWIVENACGTGEPPYRDTDRDTVFMLGRMFVAAQIMALKAINISALVGRPGEQG